MNTTAIIMIAMAVLVLWLMLSKKNNKETVKVFDSVHNENEKLTETQLDYFFDRDTYNLFKFLKDELSRLGEPDFLWRGAENGWVYSLKGSQGKFGSVVLGKSELTGQLVWGENQLLGIRTDKRLPGDFVLDVWLTYTDKNIAFNSAFFEKPLKTQKDVKNFITLMELSRFYGEQ